MRKVVLLILLIVIAASCGERNREKSDTLSADKKELKEGEKASGRIRNAPGARDVKGKGDRADEEDGTGLRNTTGLSAGNTTGLFPGAVIIARDIVTEVIIRPDPQGDPWEIEKVAGFSGEPLVDGIFSRIYDGSLTVYDYHSGNPLSPADVKKIEGEFKNDRTKIGKLSFTEDWYYYPEENRVIKQARSVTFGYELYNNVGKVYAYRAAFRADLQ
jgi:hypothetical protein